MTDKHCPYCYARRPAEDFRLVLRAGSPRWMCLPCIEIRKKPREVREELAKLESKERKKR